MSLDTFDNLKTAIGKWVDRDDLNDAAPDNFIEEFIILAESRHQRDVRIKQMITRAAITIDDRNVAFPTGHLETINLKLLTSPVTILTYMNMHELDRVRQESTGTPSFFTEASDFEFDVAPASAFSGQISYYQSLTPLSASNPSNILLVRAPDAYLYGALAASAPFLLDDARVTTWNSFYKDAVSGLKNVDGKSKPGPQVSRVAGPTP